MVVLAVRLRFQREMRESKLDAQALQSVNGPSALGRLVILAVPVASVGVDEADGRVCR